MKLPDTFPKQFKITLSINMEDLLGFGVSEWGRVLKQSLNSAEYIAAEEIKDFRLRNRIFRHYGVDPGEKFEMDYHYAWVTTDDYVIQLLRLDMLPLSSRALDAEIGLLDGELEEFANEDGEILIREVKKD